MTNPYAQPEQPGGPQWGSSQDPTIPLVPEQGYDDRPSPWSQGYEQTAVDPLGSTGPLPYTNPTVPAPAPARQRPDLPPSAPYRPATASAPGHVYEQPPVGYSPYGQPQDAAPLVPVGYPAGYPAAAYPVVTGQLPEHPSAVPTLVLAVLGFMFPITFPIAWYLGARGGREAASNPHRWRHSTVMTVGTVIGIIGTVLMLLGIVAFILFMFALVVAA